MCPLSYGAWVLIKSSILFELVHLQNTLQDEVDDEYEEEPEVADEFDSDFNEDVSYISVPFHNLFCSTIKLFS